MLQRESALRLRAPASPFVGAILTSSRYWREREERGEGEREGRECGRERQRESEHSRLLFVSPKQRREADGRKEGPASPPPPPCCLPAPLAFCCVLAGREDAPAPSCPGIGVVFAGRFVDLQPCPRCARSFANNP